MGYKKTKKKGKKKKKKKTLIWRNHQVRKQLIFFKYNIKISSFISINRKPKDTFETAQTCISFIVSKDQMEQSWLRNINKVKGKI